MPPSPVRRLDQNLLSMRCSQLLVETVWEDELSEEKFATLFEGVETKPRHIGLAPGYTSVGRLTVLAVAIGSNVSLVRFRNNREGKTLSATLQRIQDALLCNTDNLFYAFDMGPLALSLYIDQRLRITGAIDVQCGCTAKDDRDRDVANAVQFAVKGTSNDRIHRENIVATFKDQVWDERKTANSLAFRAWLAGFLPSVGDMELRFAEVPRINTLDMSDDVSRASLSWICGGASSLMNPSCRNCRFSLSSCDRISDSTQPSPAPRRSTSSLPSHPTTTSSNCGLNGFKLEYMETCAVFLLLVTARGLK